jgi:hypothetical protein
VLEFAVVKQGHARNKLLQTARSISRSIFYIEVSPENQVAVTDLFRSCDYDIFHLQGDASEQRVQECTFYTVARPRDAAG